ncbi:MAG: hypothetical protein A3G93_16470 [Nitrospinae bacterium RIFCSPLOWO2_12_FULL_45_22]|nr:MAG: hypothetical protein A3G93_16470 [Nitrospinae bacterium RIFCSPLOWO2_12_FULL_45_22]
MPQLQIEITVEDIKKILPQLSKTQILELDQKIHEYLETQMMMAAAATAFSEWEDPEEDIYNEYL